MMETSGMVRELSSTNDRTVSLRAFEVENGRTRLDVENHLQRFLPERDLRGQSWRIQVSRDIHRTLISFPRTCQVKVILDIRLFDLAVKVVSRQRREPSLSERVGSCQSLFVGFLWFEHTIHVNVEVWLEDSPLEVTVPSRCH